MHKLPAPELRCWFERKAVEDVDSTLIRREQQEPIRTDIRAIRSVVSVGPGNTSAAGLVAVRSNPASARSVQVPDYPLVDGSNSASTSAQTVFRSAPWGVMQISSRLRAQASDSASTRVPELL